VDQGTPADFGRILEVFVRHDVRFIVVGGISAVLQGAPLSTFDLDLVHHRGAENLDRLLEAVTELNAFYRGRGNQRIAPGRDQLSTPGHQLLMTDAGPLDLLGSVGDGLTYDDLLSETNELFLTETLSFRVLNLPALLRLKEHLGRDKDKASLAVLRRTIEENERG
jgi:predicted nucleotidyltransferase